MPPHEVDALTRARRQAVTSAVVVALIALGVVLVAALVLAVQRSTAQHLLGMSEEQQGVVTAIDEVSVCGRQDTDTYTVEWTAEGETRTGTFGLCGNPYEVGEELTVWVADGELQTDPPWQVRLGVGIPALLLVVALTLTLRHLGRRRRSLAAALDGTWQPESRHTLGLPGSRGFRLAASGTVETTPVAGWRLRVMHRTPSESVRAGAATHDLPGVLHADRIRGGKPTGLCLHTAAGGSRTWFVR